MKIIYLALLSLLFPICPAHAAVYVTNISVANSAEVKLTDTKWDCSLKGGKAVFEFVVEKDKKLGATYDAVDMYVLNRPVEGLDLSKSIDLALIDRRARSRDENHVFEMNEEEISRTVFLVGYWTKDKPGCLTYYQIPAKLLCAK